MQKGFVVELYRNFWSAVFTTDCLTVNMVVVEAYWKPKSNAFGVLITGNNFINLLSQILYIKAQLKKFTCAFKGCVNGNF